jgi:transcriptional regulator with XRE-family HTH domain
VDPRFLLVFCYNSAAVTTAFAEEAIHIRETGHLSDRDIARATGAGVSTVGAWLRRTRSPRGERAERLAELSAMVERLARVIEPSYIPVWLHKPVAALDDEKPIDVLAHGEWRRVARLISELESPMLS